MQHVQWVGTCCMQKAIVVSGPCPSAVVWGFCFVWYFVPHPCLLNDARNGLGQKRRPRGHWKSIRQKSCVAFLALRAGPELPPGKEASRQVAMSSLYLMLFLKDSPPPTQPHLGN